MLLGTEGYPHTIRVALVDPETGIEIARTRVTFEATDNAWYRDPRTLACAVTEALAAAPNVTAARADGLGACVAADDTPTPIRRALERHGWPYLEPLARA